MIIPPRRLIAGQQSRFVGIARFQTIVGWYNDRNRTTETTCVGNLGKPARAIECNYTTWYNHEEVVS